jgi:hypothetical protein
MSTIIAGRFETLEKAEQAIQVLMSSESLESENICTFYVGPPGQHATHPLGGDHTTDSHSTEAHTEGMKGGAIGAGVVGLAALAAGPVAAVAGAAVGAYVGSLAGALSGMNEDEATAQGGQVVRHAGVMVATRIADTTDEASVVRTLEQQGAQDVEMTQGQWRHGAWVDFDPASPPRLITRDQTN